MIPILFDKYLELPHGNIVGAYCKRMSDCISAVVSEELNGKYELTVQYPSESELSNEIEVGSQIGVIPNQYRYETDVPTDHEYWKLDYFRVYKISRDLNGVMTLNCEHISYWLATQPVKPFSVTALSQVWSHLGADYQGHNTFSYMSDGEVTKNFSTSGISNIREVLSKLQETYGGELEFIHYECRLYLNGRARHSDPWVIRYGDNLTEFKMDSDISTMYTKILPYWGNVYGSYINTPMLPGYYGNYNSVMLLEVSKMGGSQTVASINAVASAWYNARISENPNYFGPEFTITCNPISEDTAKSIVIGDPVKVIVPKYNIVQNSKVVSFEWDVLLNRYKKLTIGTIKKNIGSVIAGIERQK